jgi:hypothetical protein
MISETNQNSNQRQEIKGKVLILSILLGFTAVCNAANPTILSVQIVTDAGAGSSWDATTTPAPVSNGTTVSLCAVIKVSGATHNYYWGYADSTSAVAGIGEKVYLWDTSCWGTPTISWQLISPKGAPSSGNYNDPWKSDYGCYTNVVVDYTSGNNVACPHNHLFANPSILTFLGDSFTNGGITCIPSCTACAGGTHNSCSSYRGVQSRTNEGNNCAIIEYEHNSAGTGWGITDSGSSGVTHYTLSLTYNSSTYYSRGRQYSSSTSKLIYDTSSSEWAYNRGIKDAVTRIVRLGTNASTYLKHIESYALVPWVYGSWSFQARDYIGFDCADLAQAAAYRAGLSSDYENKAQDLANTRPQLCGADEPYTLTSGGVLKKSNGSDASITIGTNINFGDLLMLDHDGNGTVDHTTILYNKGTNLLSGDDTLICAGHNGSTSGVITKTLSDEKSAWPDMKIYLRQGW